MLNHLAPKFNGCLCGTRGRERVDSSNEYPVHQNELELLLAEYRRRFVQKQNRPIYDLFDKQKAFNDDPARFKVAVTSRRAGKTTLAASRLIDAAEKSPNTYCPYIALTRDSAKRIMWPTLTQMNFEYGLNAKLHESSLSLELPNQSTIFIVGADSPNFIDRLRGAKYKRVAIDEAQGFGDHIHQLIDEVITPALIDLNGDLDLYGTPNPIPKGFFYDISQHDRGFKCFTWNIFNNPHIPNKDQFIQELLNKKGWTQNHPTFQREWLGLWAQDASHQLFDFDETKNAMTATLDRPLIVIGIDFGYDDKTAICVLEYSLTQKRVHVKRSFARSRLILSEIASILTQLIEQYQPVKIVADTGGLGKAMAEELKQRHFLNIHPAKKTDKAARINALNDALRTQQLTIDKAQRSLIAELLQATKNEKGIENEGDQVDEIDALLYSFSEAKHHLAEQEAEKIPLHDERRLWKEEPEYLEWWER